MTHLGDRKPTTEDLLESARLFHRRVVEAHMTAEHQQYAKFAAIKGNFTTEELEKFERVLLIAMGELCK